MLTLHSITPCNHHETGAMAGASTAKKSNGTGKDEKYEKISKILSYLSITRFFLRSGSRARAQSVLPVAVLS